MSQGNARNYFILQTKCFNSLNYVLCSKLSLKVNQKKKKIFWGLKNEVFES